ncbi:MAG: ribosome small subunit-dependent GTPase A [Bacilli bacterium]|nr:ribosome small subunit-dependent GTPase A [Bacilli bacterium]
MLKGRIQSINSTKYFVDADGTIYDCTLRGIFRKDKIIPLVGDYVEINEKDLQITKIFSRINQLKRPNIANVDIAVIVTSVKKPDLDLMLLDKLLVMINYSKVKPIICFSKVDLLDEKELNDYKIVKDYYQKIGVDIIENSDIKTFKKIASGKVLVLCGQTGAGKSSFINKIDRSFNLETKPISNSLNRGVHTTRYVSLYKIDDFFIADTPGFSALDLNELSKEDIQNGFIEFKKYKCQYNDCDHLNTDGCMVKNNKEILQSRYINYVKLMKEYYENSRKFFKK